MKRICALFACLLVPLAPGCDRPIPVAPEGSTLTITANPSKIQIFGTSSITILARKLDGTPVNSGTEITLSTNLGEIPELVKTNAGGVALATLTGDGRVGTATVQAFSGAAGEAMIDVAIGGLASFLELSAQPSVISRDGGETVLRALAFDNDGAPLVGNFITFSSEIGLLADGGSIQTDTSGQATDTLTVSRSDISNVADSFFLVTATTSGEGGAPIEESIEIAIGGVPASMFFQATPTAIPNTGGTIQLLVGVRDGAGDPLPGVLVNFGTGVGTLASGGSARPTNDMGEVRDSLTATGVQLGSFSGSVFTITAQAASIGGQVLEQSAQIQITAGVPRATFTASPIDSVPCRTYRFVSTSTGGLAPLSCSWVFEGGGTDSTCSAQFEFPAAGNNTRQVTLTVTDQVGQSDSESASVQVPHTGGTNCP